MKGGGIEFILQTKRNEAKGGRERALKDAGVSSRPVKVVNEILGSGNLKVRWGQANVE